MLPNSVSVLLPVLFVLGLGYWAGLAKRFDADQVKGVNELVLDFALPAIMFVGIVKGAPGEAAAETPFLLALLAGLAGFYIAILAASLLVLRRSLGEAALQACSLSFPSVAFMGIPIFKGLFGEASLLSITWATVLANLTIAPLTVVLLEMHSKRAARAQAEGESEVAQLIGDVWAALGSSLVKPMVWSPLCAVALVLLGIPVPKEFDDMLALIGSTTSGVALFAAGLIIAAYRIRVNMEIVGNVIAKMVAQPLFMAVLVLVFSVSQPLAREAILMGAIPTSAFATLLAPRYGVYETECASTLVLTAIAMIVVLPVTIMLTG
jgi:predicted permease